LICSAASRIGLSSLDLGLCCRTMQTPVHPSFARSPRFLAALLGLAVAACNSSSTDQAAKARIFSPEEPAIDVRRAAESIDVDAAATDGDIWARLWRMDRMEATRRIGGHRATSKVNFKWTRAGKTVELNEEALLEVDADGQFHATLTNDQDAGLEFIWVNGQAFAKGRYGEYRARRTDRGQQNTIREEASSALRTVFDLLGRRLHGSPSGSATVAGRQGKRFTLSLGEPWGPAEVKPKTVAPVFGKVRTAGKDVEDEATDGGTRDSKFAPGPDEQTARRLEFAERQTPEAVSGDVVIDEKASVILRSNVKARFKVPEANGEGAVLTVSVTYNVEPAASLAIAPPKNVTAPRLPHAVVNPLWFLDGGSSGAPAGTADEPAGAEDDEPSEAR
jgi:hypothetical protein